MKNSDIIGRKLIVKEYSSGTMSDYRSNHQKYFGQIINKVVTCVHVFEQEGIADFYLTDFFIPEFKDEDNDYVYHGFVKLMRSDFNILPIWEN